MANMVNCPRCGRPTPDATFCHHCGRSLHSCGACGARISRYSLYCPDCGAAIPKERREEIPVERTSWAWWLLPVFLTWVGGVIAWSMLKYKNPPKASQCLWLGVSLTVIEIIITIVVRLTYTPAPS
ncbi:MAG TPA: zinc ribbon domain-containing protein [Dehalococcoidia bacterium]|nr:zinc ribbon domain-containing protein [Dehalococcoidia bacterium]